MHVVFVRAVKSGLIALNMTVGFYLSALVLMFLLLLPHRMTLGENPAPDNFTIIALQTSVLSLRCLYQINSFVCKRKSCRACSWGIPVRIKGLSQVFRYCVMAQKCHIFCWASLACCILQTIVNTVWETQNALLKPGVKWKWGPLCTFENHRMSLFKWLFTDCLRYFDNKPELTKKNPLLLYECLKVLFFS